MESVFGVNVVVFMPNTFFRYVNLSGGFDGRIGSGASQKAAYCKVQLLSQSS